MLPGRVGRGKPTEPTAFTPKTAIATQLATILATAQAALADVTDMVGLEQVKARYLGKSGELTELLKQLGKTAA